MSSYFFTLPSSGRELEVEGKWTKGQAPSWYEPGEPTEFEPETITAWDGEKWEKVELSAAEWEELQPLLDVMIEEANMNPDRFFGDPYD